jgi:nitrite reductase/ring-hydroxylating ferredoxin subunit
MKTSFVIHLFLILILFNGCSKQENKNEIPVVAVYFVINPNSTEYRELNVVDGSVTVTGGYNGIIVFKKSLTEFMAFERACPNDWENTDAKVNVEASGITAICPICKSQFILTDGSPISGPSHYPLKQYQTSYDGNFLYVTN